MSKMKNQFLHNNVGDGTLSQVIHGGTRLTGVGGAHNIFWVIFLLQFLSFTVDGDPL